MNRKKEKPKKSKRRLIVDWATQLVILAAVVIGMWAWQTRNMVASGDAAPQFSLNDVEGVRHALSDGSGKKVILYFFAPWCSVCHASSHNINALRAALDTEDVDIYAIGLRYETSDEVRQFAQKHALDVPVLVGTDRTAAAYRVSTFPSIYILDSEHRIAHRLVGYTTEMGLRIRTALAGWW